MMKRFTLILTGALGIAMAAFGPALSPVAAQKRPIEISDFSAWKIVTAPALSNDGRWFAYRISPIDGDTEVVIRETHGDKEYRFPGGDFKGARRTDPSAGPGVVTYSEDSHWLAFTKSPTKKEVAAFQKQKKASHNAVMLVNLSNGTTTAFDKVRSFVFSPGTAAWLALQEYGPEVAAGLPGPPAAIGKGKSKGADLVLHELSSGAEMNLGNVSEFAFDKTGHWLAWTVDAQDRAGNGVMLRDLETGIVKPLDSDRAIYSRLTWTEKGDALAVLKQTDDKRFKDKLCSIVGFTGFEDGNPVKVVYDPRARSLLPAWHVHQPQQ